MAARYPRRVKKLILASAVTKKWLDLNESVYRMGRKIFRPGVEEAVWGMVRMLSVIAPTLIANSFYPQLLKVKRYRLAKQEILELTTAFGHYTSIDGFLCDIDHTMDERVLAKIECLILIVYSHNDSSVPFDHAEHAHALIRNSALMALDNEWGYLFWIGADSKDTIGKIMPFLGS